MRVFVRRWGWPIYLPSTVGGAALPAERFDDRTFTAVGVRLGGRTVRVRFLSEADFRAAQSGATFLVFHAEV